jgi:hypothetical protein
LLGAVINVHDFDVIEVNFRKFTLALLDQILVGTDAGEFGRIFKGNLNFLFLGFRLFDVYIVAHAEDTEEASVHLIWVVVEFDRKLVS